MVSPRDHTFDRLETGEWSLSAMGTLRLQKNSRISVFWCNRDKPRRSRIDVRNSSVWGAG